MLVYLYRRQAKGTQTHNQRRGRVHRGEVGTTKRPGAVDHELVGRRVGCRRPATWRRNERVKANSRSVAAEAVAIAGPEPRRFGVYQTPRVKEEKNGHQGTWKSRASTEHQSRLVW
jgi:superfamily II DNA or RNA helicase